MNTNHSPENDSALWIDNLVDGLAGITVKAKHAIYFEASPFQKIEVFETYSFGKILMLGGKIVLTEKDEYIYNEMLSHPAMVTHGNAKNICIIGGGDGGCLREVLKHPSVESVVVIDIDKKVTNTVKKHFPSLANGFNDNRVQLIFEDGYKWIKTTKSIFDVIIVDSYNSSGPVQSLETTDFFERVREKLTDDGIAVIQTGSPELNSAEIRKNSITIKKLFSFTSPYFASIPTYPYGICTFLLCEVSKSTKIKKTTPTKELCEKCNYYGNDIHYGAFGLPSNIIDIFSS